MGSKGVVLRLDSVRGHGKRIEETLERPDLKGSSWRVNCKRVRREDVSTPFGRVSCHLEDPEVRYFNTRSDDPT